MKSQLGLGQVGTKTISVYRNNGDKREAIAATDDTRLQPGDTVEISIQIDALLSGGAGAGQ